jgi:ABC-type transport system involved in cytochrome c biogenesis ATPase subunit
VIDRLVDAVRRGEGRVLVVRGEPGVGKSALLRYLAEGATGGVARAAGLNLERMRGQ